MKRALSRVADRRAALVSFASLTLVLATACQPKAAPAASSDRPTGGAYTARVVLSLPGGAKLGVPSLAGQGLPCNPESGATARATAVSSLIPLAVPLAPSSVLSSGSAVNQGKATFDHAAGTSDIVESSAVQGVNVLGGLITADAVVSQTHVSRSTGAVDTHAADGSTGATFTNLKVAGVPVVSKPRPNTTLALPGVGSVTLNAQSATPAFFGTPAKFGVDAISVEVDDLAGISGTIQVAHSEAGLGQSAGRIGASGFLVQVAAKPVASVGPLGSASMACAGTGGLDKTVDQVGVSVPVVGNVGIGHVTVSGDQRDGSNQSHATTTVGAIDLLDHAITADALVSKASSYAGSGGVRSDGLGSSFTNLVIGGTPISGPVAPNTRLELPGIGSVTLNEQGCWSDRTGQRASCTADHRTQMQVTAIRIRVTVTNTLGLPIGADIAVGRALSNAAD
jgi:hypothetical protein